MASNPSVFEVMIHRVEAGADAASLLQQRLRQDGIRAGVADLSAAKATSAARAARHSLCFVGAAFGEEDLAGAPHDRFDLVFISPDAEAGGRVVATHFGTATRNIHGLALEMRFATVVGRKDGLPWRGGAVSSAASGQAGPGPSGKNELG